MTTSISGTGGVTFNDNSVQNTAAKTGMVNKIINGAMVIDQRNAGASVSVQTSTEYSLDRWRVYSSQNSKYSVQQSTTVPAGFKNSLLITSSSAYAVVATDIFAVSQYIEGFNVADLGWGSAGAASITLSFWVRSSLTGTFGGSLTNGGYTRSYPFTYTISVANTWEQKSITIAGDTTGTWATDNTAGIRVWLGLGVGTSFSGTANAWASAEYESITGATSVVGTSGATFYITGVQLEKGSTATSFDYRPYGTELALCQRYYSQGTIVPTYNGAALSVTMPAFNFYGQPMRISPTVTVANGAVGYGYPQGFVAVSSAPISATSYYLPGAYTATAEL
jgi:hypothetical protein